jgi:hypothetical protein
MRRFASRTTGCGRWSGAGMRWAVREPRDFTRFTLADGADPGGALGTDPRVIEAERRAFF